jgi:TonB family protein
LSDFTLTLRFRALSMDTDAAIIVRTWADTWPSRGYRLALGHSALKGRELFSARRAKARAVVFRAQPAWRAVGEWQTFAVTCAESFLNVTINGMPVATFQIEDQAGELLFDVREGEVELADIEISESASAIRMAPALNDEGLVMPKVTREVKPKYTADAMQRKVEGTVGLELLVGRDGTVGGASLTRSLDPGLDREAIQAARQWRFTPALLKQRQIPIILTLELTFELRMK